MLTTRQGKRLYVLLHPYVIEPQLLMTVAVDPKRYADAGEVLGKTTGTRVEGYKAVKAEQIVTPWMDPICQSKEYQAFLRKRGYRRGKAGLYINWFSDGATISRRLAASVVAVLVPVVFAPVLALPVVLFVLRSHEQSLVLAGLVLTVGDSRSLQNYYIIS